MYILTPLNNPSCYTWKSFALQNNNIIALSTIILKTKATESNQFCNLHLNKFYMLWSYIFKCYMTISQIDWVFKYISCFKNGSVLKLNTKPNVRCVRKKLIITFLSIWTLKLGVMLFSFCVMFFSFFSSFSLAQFIQKKNWWLFNVMKCVQSIQIHIKNLMTQC